MMFYDNLNFTQRNYKRLLMLIDEVYRWLPLGSLLNNRVLVVHGGFADSTDLEYIKTIDRGKVIISHFV